MISDGQVTLWTRATEDYLRQHRVVLELRLSQGWGISGNDHKLRLARSKRLEG